MKRLPIIISLMILVTLSACSGRDQAGKTEATGVEVNDEKTDIRDAALNKDNSDTVDATVSGENTDITEAIVNEGVTDKEGTDGNDGITGVPEAETINPEEGFSEGIWIKKYPGNNACFKLETPEGFQIVCDPYDINETLQPDIVTESHQDSDHTDTGSLTMPYDLITDAGDYSYDEVGIKGYAGNHNKGDRSGINNIFVFSFDDITIAHFASQGALPSDEVLEQIGTVDVLLVQFFINPNYNKLTAADVEKIVAKLKPKIIIPEHCDASSAGWLATRMKLAEEIEASGSLVVTREMLDAADKIRIISLEQE